MNKVRDIRRRPFYWIDNAFMDDYAATVGLAAIATYNALARRANQEGHAWPGKSDLMRLTGLSRYGVSRALTTLSDHGIISIKHRRDAGQWRTNVYTLLPVSNWVGNSVAQGRQLSRPGVGNSVAQGRQLSRPGVGNSVAPNNTHTTTNKNKTQLEQHTSTTSEHAAVDAVEIEKLPKVTADLLKKHSVNIEHLNGQATSVAAWLLDAATKGYIRNPAGFAISQVQKQQAPPDDLRRIAELDISLDEIPYAVRDEKMARQGVIGGGEPLECLGELEWPLLERIEQLFEAEA